MKAFVVEDEPIMLRSFIRMCKSIQQIDSIVGFRNALDVLALPPDETFDIAFIDIGLPTINGIQLAEALKRKNPRLLIVFVSAWEMDDTLCSTTLYDGYITKPCSVETIRNEIQRLLTK